MNENGFDEKNLLLCCVFVMLMFIAANDNQQHPMAHFFSFFSVLSN